MNVSDRRFAEGWYGARGRLTEASSDLKVEEYALSFRSLLYVSVSYNHVQRHGHSDRKGKGCQEALSAVGPSA
jgi:hypothetical protein